MVPNKKNPISLYQNQDCAHLIFIPSNLVYNFFLVKWYGDIGVHSL